MSEEIPEEIPEYEGKAKQLIPTTDRDVLFQRFKDEATAFNGEKKDEFEGKGVLNNAISCRLFSYLEEQGVPTHFLGWESPTDMKCRRLEIVPLEVVVRNNVAGSLQRRTGLAEGTEVVPPIVETYYKRDDLGDPIITDDHIKLLDLVDEDGLAQIKEMAQTVNDMLKQFFADAGLKLVDFKMEYGYDSAGNILLGDEISPDVCRIWDAETDQKFDKDVYRYELGDLIEGYREVASRLGVELGQ